jgi:hypothetical protein
MQEIGLDPLSLYKEMGCDAKVFGLYLLLVLGFSLSRSVQLGRKLWFVSAARSIPPHSMNPNAADLLAAQAMANRLRTRDSSNEGTTSERKNESSGIVEEAMPLFDYLWERSATRVSDIKNLAILTLILSGVVLSCDVRRVLAHIQIFIHPGDFDVAGGPADVLVPFVLGFAVSAVLYALSSIYAGALARRRAAWNLFVAKASTQHKAD